MDKIFLKETLAVKKKNFLNFFFNDRTNTFIVLCLMLFRNVFFYDSVHHSRRGGWTILLINYSKSKNVIYNKSIYS